MIFAGMIPCSSALLLLAMASFKTQFSTVGPQTFNSESPWDQSSPAKLSSNPVMLIMLVVLFVVLFDPEFLSYHTVSRWSKKGHVYPVSSEACWGIKVER